VDQQFYNLYKQAYKYLKNGFVSAGPDGSLILDGRSWRSNAENLLLGISNLCKHPISEQRDHGDNPRSFTCNLCENRIIW
jgi:hypothetical protein